MNDIAMYVGYAVMLISSVGFIGLLAFWTFEKIINVYAAFDLIREFIKWTQDANKGKS